VVEAAAASVVKVGPAGSGVVYGPGVVVTNAHNLRGELAVTFADGRVAVGTVAGADGEGDLAVVSVDTGDVPALEWSVRGPDLGEVVVGLSRPGSSDLRASVGFVTGLGIAFRGPGGRLLSGAIEHSAPLAHGSSGGALVDGDGRLIGLNTHRAGEGFYLALPTGPELKDRIEALAKGEEPHRVRLGVALAPPRVARRLRRAVGLPDRDGLLVHALEPGGPADRAGIRRGDLIISVSVGGAEARAVASVEELGRALDEVSAAAEPTAVVGVVRGAEELTIAVAFTASAETGPSEEAGV
jgi:serine protease Do